MTQTTIIKLRKLALLIVVQTVFIIVGFLATTVANAGTFYVATNGTDGNPGSINSPFRTVNKGVSVLKPGDTLYLRAGTYVENVQVNVEQVAGTASQPIVIAGYPG